MRYFWLILFLFSCLDHSYAQKALRFSSFFQGRHFQFVLYLDSSANIKGHCIDLQDKLKYTINGNLLQPGNIFQLNCTEHPLFRYIRLKEDINNQKGLNGFYYAPDGYIGHVNFNSSPDEFNFEDNRDLETINKLYQLMSEDFGYKVKSISPPFTHDIESGLYVLNPNNSFISERTNQKGRRKLLLAERLLHTLEEQKTEYDDVFFIQKIHFQVLGYSPYHSVLVISEETEAIISKSMDTSYICKYKLAVYTFKANNAEVFESWTNESDIHFTDASVDFINEKLPYCDVLLHSKFLELTFKRKCRISPALPRTLIYVPEQIGSTKSKTLIFNWKNLKLELE